MDPISDMLARLRNAVAMKKEVAEVPASKVKKEIARVLKEEGYIANYKIFENNKSGVLKVLLRYTKEKEPAITHLERVSRPSCRIYRSYRNFDSTGRTIETSVLTTPKGVMTARQARALKVGGEVLFKIW